MKKHKIIFLFFIVIFLSKLTLFSQINNESSDISTLDIIQFYLINEEYSDALQLIENRRFKNTQQDSVLFYKALAYEGINEYDQSLDIYALIFTTTSDSLLKKHSLQNYIKTVQKLSPSAAIDRLNIRIKQTESDTIQSELFFTIAKIYEDNQLFQEANDVYKSMLNDSIIADSTKIMINIVRNNIFLRNYIQAEALINRLLTHADSTYIPQTLYLNFQINKNLGNQKKALEILKNLYLNFPEHEFRVDILTELAKIYQDKQEYLLSWYFYNEVYKIGNESKKFKVYREIETIKKQILQADKPLNLFKHFKPDFYNSHKQQK